MYGKILLLELLFNTGSPAGFHTAGKDIVFDKLLCDGASATGIVVADQPLTALAMERISIPLWDQKRESSMATKASIRSWGSSS